MDLIGTSARLGHGGNIAEPVVGVCHGQAGPHRLLDEFSRAGSRAPCQAANAAVPIQVTQYAG
jgi:hypothetical protein